MPRLSGGHADGSSKTAGRGRGRLLELCHCYIEVWNVMDMVLSFQEKSLEVHKEYFEL